MHFNKKMALLPILFFIISNMACIKAFAQTMYENPDNGYVVVIEDDADLFTPEEEKRTCKGYGGCHTVWKCGSKNDYI